MANKIHYLGDSNLGPRGGKLYVFHCPGCKSSHPYEVGAPNGTGWTWNGSMEKPTFSPSLLVWASRPEARCHLYMVDGQIRFQPDCYHELAGKTVEAPDWDESDSGFG